MKSLKIHLNENADTNQMLELLLLIKGIKSVEIVNEENLEIDL